jgi:hypothetical protein
VEGGKGPTCEFFGGLGKCKVVMAPHLHKGLGISRETYGGA